MSALSGEQVAAYALRHAIFADGQSPQVLLEEHDGETQRFRLQAGEHTALFTCYAPSALDRARRASAGLQLAGQMGLAPALLLYREHEPAMGGAVVITQQPRGKPLGGHPLASEEVSQWLFLLLTLHHLPPNAVGLPSSMSPSAESWWQRTQPAWVSCQATLQDACYRPLIEAVKQMHVIAGVHLDAHRELWRDVPRRVCHGDMQTAHIVRDGAQLRFVNWEHCGLGDPALEIGRAAVLALLAEELDDEGYRRLLTEYLAGMRDLGDATLEERLRVFTSVAPLGFTDVVSSK